MPIGSKKTTALKDFYLTDSHTLEKAIYLGEHEVTANGRVVKGYGGKYEHEVVGMNSGSRQNVWFQELSTDKIWFSPSLGCVTKIERIKTGANSGSRLTLKSYTLK